MFDETSGRNIKACLVWQNVFTLYFLFSLKITHICFIAQTLQIEAVSIVRQGHIWLHSINSFSQTITGVDVSLSVMCLVSVLHSIYVTFFLRVVYMSHCSHYRFVFSNICIGNSIFIISSKIKAICQTNWRIMHWPSIGL
jgi:hypothetical protein